MHGICSLAAVQASATKKNMSKNNKVTLIMMVLELKFIAFDCGEDSEHGGVGLMISKILAMHD